jgi:hypothetical protein
MRKFYALLGLVILALGVHLFLTPHYGKCHNTDLGSTCTLTHYTIKGAK